MTASRPGCTSTGSTVRAQSRFAGRRIKDYLRQEYRNQDGELVATFICSRIRFERSEAQSRREITRGAGTAPVDRSRTRSHRGRRARRSPPRGQPRYWEDVQVGDEIDMITKGPLGLTDEIAYIASGAAPIPRLSAHGVALRRYRKHPRWAFRDPATHALEPVYSVHYNDYAARLQGAQAAYDVGIQRTCWQIHSLTNWMGDAGFLKAATLPVPLARVPRRRRPPRRHRGAKGSRRRRRARRPPATWARNQRGQEVMPGTAA